MRINIPPTSNNILYFFSTLAQCAAAFSSLSAVFAVFRLQADDDIVIETYSKARKWLADRGCRTTLEQKEQVESFLQDIIDGKKKVDDKGSGTGKEGAKKQLNNIITQKSFRDVLIKRLKDPLELWIGVFIFSMVALSVEKFSFEAFYYLALPFVTLMTFFAVWTTYTFIRDCLGKPSL